jgi:energy-coupling factor transport system ATP-binding protein
VTSLDVSIAGREVLHHVDLTVGAGEIVAIMGRNGSGKTTLLRTIVGLIEPTHGRIAVEGTDVTQLPVEKRGRLIGFVPQDPRVLLFQPSVREELSWTLAQEQRYGTEDEEARVDRTLALLDLEACADAHPRDLSTGEQQRTALATALVRDPPVLLLDEPTRGLDYLNKERLLQALRALREEQRAIVLVTHDVELVAACADRVLLLGEGEVVTEGPTRTLLHESLIFSSQIGKLFPQQEWLTAQEAIAGLTASSG